MKTNPHQDTSQLMSTTSKWKGSLKPERKERISLKG